jgi:hypothetical protein
VPARPHRPRSGELGVTATARAIGRALAAALVLALAAGWAGAISYTVQVIAVSDQESAIGIYRELAREGYPAYVVRTTGEAGDVYRVRVGAFANRAAALRYAEGMPAIGGSRPVPALAEAIPQGIMPLAPRLLWQHEWEGADVRVVPWPVGVALRVQSLDPLRQAQYVVFQAGEERRFEAWAVVPLSFVPDVGDDDALAGIPLVDLTVPPAAAGETVAPGGEPPAAAEGTVAPGGEPPSAAEETVTPAADEADDAPRADDADEADDADAEGGEEERETEATAAAHELAPFVLAPDSDDPEAGLALLRDRPLWPPTWQDDAETVRETFRASLVTLVARDVGVTPAEVEALAYLPGGDLPPALIVLDVTDRSGRDVGAVVALGDPNADLRTTGPALVLPAGEDWSLPAWPSTRLIPDALAPQSGFEGAAWTAVGDGGFVRLTLDDGATWRAGFGMPIWSDGRYLMAWDGRLLLLYEFEAR